MRPANGTAPAFQRDEAELGLTPDIIQRMADIAKTLSRTRKQRHFPNLAPVADMKRLACKSSHSAHQSTAPGVLCLDVHKTDDSRILTGGVDSQVILFNRDTAKTVQKLVGHTKKVTSVLFHPTREVLLSASQDATVRVWKCSDAAKWEAPYDCAHIVRRHAGEVVDLSIHPLGDYFLSASRDKSWAVHDFGSGRCVRHVKDLDNTFGCMKFHPDGLILAGGTEEKTVTVWDIKEQVTVATLPGHEGPIEVLSFSENGYYLATGSRDGEVKLWDLRKPLNIQTLQVSNDPITSLRFDQTGQYLAVGAGVVQIYNFETKASMKLTTELKDHEATVTGVCFGSNAHTLASTSMDRTLRLYTIPPAA